MEKRVGKYVLTLVMAILALFQAVSGFILWLALPYGGGYKYRGGSSGVAHTTFLLDRHTWITYHEWVSVALLILVIIHVILHRRWLVRMTKSLGK